MKIPVTPESTNVHIENYSIVSVISKEIGKYREVLQVLRELIVGYRESLFFHLR